MKIQASQISINFRAPLTIPISPQKSGCEESSVKETPCVFKNPHDLKRAAKLIGKPLNTASLHPRVSSVLTGDNATSPPTTNIGEEPSAGVGQEASPVTLADAVDAMVNQGLTIDSTHLESVEMLMQFNNADEARDLLQALMGALPWVHTDSSEKHRALCDEIRELIAANIFPTDPRTSRFFTNELAKFKPEIHDALASLVNLPSSFEVYGKSRIIPKALLKDDFQSALYDFGLLGDFQGTGIALSDGLMLTAGHVISNYLPATHPFQDWPQSDVIMCERGFEAHYLPPRGSFTGDQGPNFEVADAGTWNDFALVKDTNSGTMPKHILPWRRTTDLDFGEPLWALGDKTNDRVRVSQGTFGGMSGANAILENIKIEGGFSGGPVVDVHGNLVGITVVGNSDASWGYMVSTDAILAYLERDKPELLDRIPRAYHP